MGRPVSYRVAMGLCALCLLWFLGMSAYFAQLPGGPLDLKFTVAGTMEAIERYGEAGRDVHRWGTRYLDAVFPFLLGSTLLICLIRSAEGRRRGTLSVLVLFYIFADQIENMAISRLLALDFDWVDTKVWATWVKYLCLVLPLLFVLSELWRESREMPD